ncbi:M10 family metallopeptidase C-terminal domain-containing protein [Phenylobacterium sp. J426]|uniref:M10 family metallopeptidase C-terminal domain-containing protein n=1 Tax=Phenylobacterium sp. J426 TaxID=2898439 RepID=UPI002150C97D|nr:M10 family metallopeptidase C-terminal domain-containing protein [Phenylobacterium sp. J426]MCR5875816.1 M10 family metallopeptidase C-terminal domain-containing protein [Phenylobacterium sp. J426]
MPAPAEAIAAIHAALPARLDVWGPTPDQPLTITYAFKSEQSAEFLRPYLGWSAWTEAQKAAVRQALAEYESVINVRFVELAPGPSNPIIAFGRVDVASVAETWWSLSIGPDAAGQPAIKRWDAGVVFDDDVDLTDPNRQWLILHEIGHALMMKHTGDYDTTGKSTPGPFLPAAEDNRDHTVMSYVREDGAANATQLQLYDIAALQARWGANTQAAAGDDVYVFAADPSIFAIWDTGGTDRIDAAGAPGPVRIDLAEGAFSQLTGQNRISIAWGSRIEDATGGAFADRLSGNDLDNRLMGGAGDDTLLGGAGRNVLRGEAGDDSLLGGDDFDDLHGNIGEDTVRGGGGDDWVVGGQGRDELFGDAGFDIVYGNLGDDTCEGGAGDDWVRGGQGNDVVRGGDGNDWLWGDRGDDTISGGAGADDFHLQAGCALDLVVDFSLADGDRVFVDGGVAYTVSIWGADTVIDLGGGDRMVLLGVQLPPGAWLVVG